ncbi:hypothetical protein ASG60_16630 [Methylobacterium sp. Leaf469]|nr:hypothetical protein ASG60_16630 [Methylobacterium sp. Leaf469]
MFVAAIVVQNDVDEFAGRHDGLDGVEETDELAVAMTLHATTEHGAIQDVEGGKQGRGAVAGIVVGLRGWVAWTEGLIGAGALQGLDPALFVDGQHHGVGRRIHIKAHDLLDFLGEGRIVRADPMRLQAMLLPDPLHGAQ